jgi:hypothetical protein
MGQLFEPGLMEVLCRSGMIDHHIEMYRTGRLAPLPAHDSPSLQHALLTLLHVVEGGLRLREQFEAQQCFLEAIDKVVDIQERRQDQLLEIQVSIDRLQSGRRRPPNRSTLIRQKFFQALRECGFPEDQIMRAYNRFQMLLEPATSPAAQRVRKYRTKKAMSEPLAKSEPE